MATEIELKAWVDDPDALAARLDTLGKPVKSYEKEDAYWVNAALEPPEIRIRREKDKIAPRSDTGRNTYPKRRAFTLVTFKKKRLDAGTGIELNEENEFTVSDGEVFACLLHRQGYRVETVKRKRGKAWRCPGTTPGGILAELSFVEGLGYFVELEVVDSGMEGAVQAGSEACKRSLLALLEKAGIPESKIERRYYSEMLAEKKINFSGQTPNSVG